MGPQLGAVCYALFLDVAWLHTKWLQFRTLYALSAERVSFLNTIASTFFGTVAVVMWDDVLLHIARLTDPPRSGGRKNLTLRRLAEMVPDAMLRNDVEKLVQDLQEAASFARDWRNALVAHHDLDVALRTDARRLEDASREKVEKALEAIRVLLNEVLTRYGEAPIAFEHMPSEPDGPDALLHYLQIGARAEECRRKRLEEGRPLPEDLERLDNI